MRAWMCALGVCAVALGTASGASALDCGRRLVVEGDTAAYVRSVCGEPAQISTRTESRSRFVAGRGGAGGDVIGGSSVTVTVTVETWVYDFGPRRFMQAVEIVDGIVRSIRTLGYGTARGDARRASIERIPAWRGGRRGAARSATACATDALADHGWSAQPPITAPIQRARIALA